MADDVHVGQALAEQLHSDDAQSRDIVLSSAHDDRGAESGLDDLITVAPSMRRLLHIVAQVADIDSTVLITGESGVGKEILARRLFQQSRRSRRAFVAVNCAAIPESLVESELFGCRRGAFTGAVDRKGLLEEAEGGVLFLDEIGDMPFSMQSRLLRFLDTREVRRLGDTAARCGDVRIIAATNRALEEEVWAGRFRADLFYRLSVISLHVPPLRDRVDDISPLAHFYLARSAARVRKPLRGLTADAMSALERHDWRGNVRELQNVMERAAIHASGETLDVRDITGALNRSAPCHDRPPRATMETLAQALERSGGNRSDAAAALGINRTTLWRRLKRQKRSGPGPLAQRWP